MINGLVLIAALAAGGLLLLPRLARATLWRASITPLASIIGSGFLVIGPVLTLSFGMWAVGVMTALCLAAYLFGGAIRFNIVRLAGQDGARTDTEERLERAAAWALSFAYVISVAYYLNLFGAFAVSLTEMNTQFNAKLVSTGVFAFILVVGFRSGFGALERLEQVSVGIKLSVIAGLLAGLVWFFAGRAGAGGVLLSPATVTGWAAVTLVAGLLVTVQGFETSRYLGAVYDAPTRVRSMRIAQALSAAIYIVYIALISFVFSPDSLPGDETAIVAIMAQVAPVLPLLLVVAALSAQFSAAVADTGGAGGLFTELTGGRLPARGGYVVLVGIGVLLTWSASVFELISYASRAFAVYYALQAMIAARGAWAQRHQARSAVFAALAVCGAAVALFGTAIE